MSVEPPSSSSIIPPLSHKPPYLGKQRHKGRITKGNYDTRWGGDTKGANL